MLWYIAIVLGIVQGLGEFLPISSSAHLILTRWFFDWDPVINGLGANMDIVLDVALHVGTLLAVLIYFFQDWLQLARNGLSKGGLHTREGKMFWYLVAATIPGGLVGLAFESVIESTVRSQVLIIAGGLAMMGIILYYVDKTAPQTIRFDKIGFKQAMLIGCAQALALIPGVSRSGITMTMGRWLGFSREAAAKFSFLLSTPIIAGAALKQTPSIINNINNPLFLVGTLTSAIVGLICISCLLKYLQRHNFAIFAVYRLVLAAAVVVVYMLRNI